MHNPASHVLGGHGMGTSPQLVVAPALKPVIRPCDQTVNHHITWRQQPSPFAGSLTKLTYKHNVHIHTVCTLVHTQSANGDKLMQFLYAIFSQANWV